jgi:hypothetical protein
VILSDVCDLADSVFVVLAGRNYSVDGFRSHHLLRQRAYLSESSTSTLT